MDLLNRVVILTGAKRIGAVVAAGCAARGAAVAMAYNRSRDEADAAVAGIVSQGGRGMVVHADVSKPEDCDGLIAAVDREFGRVDVLINMASVYHERAFDTLDAVLWDQQLAVDLRGAFLCSRAAVPIMRRSGGGRIINFSDWVASSGRPRYKGYLPYYVAKAGVKALTEALALELAGDGILVNAIAPGPVLAPDDLTAEQKKAVEDATPLRKWGGADEILKAVLALIDSDFITGETIRVDGGRHLS